MSPSLLEPLLTVVSLLSLGVFVLAFKFVAHEACHSREHRFAPSLPRAALWTAGRGASERGAGERWLRGLGRQRLLSCVRTMQTGIVAFGVTAAFIMFLCMAGIVAAMLVGPL